MGEKSEIYYNLTHPQKRIWHLDKINEGSQLNNIGGCLRIKGPIDLLRMEQAINLVIKNNEGLRLRIVERDTQPVQYLAEAVYERIDFVDFSGCCNYSREKELWAEHIFQIHTPLYDSPLYYFAMYQLTDKEYGILLKIHHIIADGWSIVLIQKQICDIYTRLCEDEQVFKPNDSYLNYIQEESIYLNSRRFKKNKEFWNKMFAELPMDSLYKTYNHLRGARESFVIDKNVTHKIKRYIEGNHCSLNTFFVAVMVICVYKIENKSDIVIGLPVFNRINKTQKNMIGMFTSTVPFRFQLDKDDCIDEYIRKVSNKLKDCLMNQRYPYDLLIKDINLQAAGFDSLFKICVNYYNKAFDYKIGEFDAFVEEYYCGHQSYSLQFTIKEWDQGEIAVNFDYKAEEYSAIKIKTMFVIIMNIVNEIVTSNHHLKLREIQMLDRQERDFKLYGLNKTKALYPKKTVYELFEEQACHTPDRVAVTFGENEITYETLNHTANQLAFLLRGRGIGRQAVVAVMQTHSIELMVSILAVLKCGAAYLPIDAEYPDDRVNYMLNDSGCGMLLVNNNVEREIRFHGSVINVRDISVERFDKSDYFEKNKLDDLAYIIYTSGSTGQPKGVMVKHRGLTNYICWANKMYLRQPDEAVALYSSISFDLTVTSLFMPLISGNRIVIYGTDEDEFVLHKIIREDRAAVIKLTPSHLYLLKDMEPKTFNLKRLIVGGEELKTELARNIYRCFNREVEIYNEYGPTETVVGCMIHQFDEMLDKRTSVPIGRPADNVQIYVLDQELNPMPTGFVGELYISGDGVAEGYLGRKQLTEEKFVNNPFIRGKKMYKTDDMARYFENGIIEYAGRHDKQVKIRGYRIELAEIEQCLMKHEYINAAVLAVVEDLHGNKIINAYLQADYEVPESEIRNWLKALLPEYMIPARYIFVEKIPLTLNGKIDLSRLPETNEKEKRSGSIFTHTGNEFVEAVKEILGLETLYLEDNFYQLGGDSIKAIQIAARLKNAGKKLLVKDILSHNTLKEIAASVTELEDSDRISQSMCQGSIEMTPIAAWFFSQHFKNEDYYDQYIKLECSKKLDLNMIKKAVKVILEAHDSLRIKYNREEKKLYYDNKPDETACVHYYDALQLLSPNEQIDKIMELIGDCIRIERGNLFHVVLVENEDRQYLMFIAHHLAVDGISWRIIIEDFFTALTQLQQKTEVKLARKTHSYQEWARNLKLYSKKGISEEAAYWNFVAEKAAGMKMYQKFYKSRQKGIYKDADTVSVVIPHGELEELTENTGAVYHIDLNETLLIALIVSISRVFQTDEVVIELERHGREGMNDQLDVSRTVGWFTSMYPAYFKTKNDEFNDLMKSLKEQIRALPKNGFHYSILKYLNHDIKAEYGRLIRFNYLGNFDHYHKEPHLLQNIVPGFRMDKENELSALIDVNAMVLNKELKVTALYSKKQLESEEVEQFLICFKQLLTNIAVGCSERAGVEFTPSDFDSATISQEELDAIFNETLEE